MVFKPHNYKGQDILVSSCGTIVGRRGELKQRLCADGYPIVSLGVQGRTGVKVHKLVAYCFVPNPLCYETVNHIDGDKTNNHFSNLEWCTRKRNVKLAQDEPVLAISLTTHGYGMWFPCQAEAHRLGYQQPNISKCLNGERKSHKGYKWEKSLG